MKSSRDAKYWIYITFKLTFWYEILCLKWIYFLSDYVWSLQILVYYSWWEMFTQIVHKKCKIIFITTQEFMTAEIRKNLSASHFFFPLTNVVVNFLQRWEWILNPINFSPDEQACIVKLVIIWIGYLGGTTKSIAGANIFEDRIWPSDCSCKRKEALLGFPTATSCALLSLGY